jgi:hypothetical protein
MVDEVPGRFTVTVRMLIERAAGSLTLANNWPWRGVRLAGSTARVYQVRSGPVISEGHNQIERRQWASGLGLLGGLRDHFLATSESPTCYSGVATGSRRPLVVARCEA